MDEILIAILSSTVLSTLINFLQQQHQAKSKRKELKDSRDQDVADRYYTELRGEIQELKKQLLDSEHHAERTVLSIVCEVPNREGSE